MNDITTLFRAIRRSLIRIGDVAYHATGLALHHGEVAEVTMFADGAATARVGDEFFPLARLAA